MQIFQQQIKKNHYMIRIYRLFDGQLIELEKRYYRICNKWIIY